MNTAQGILRAGELLNNTYVIEKLIGSGGTGEVYLAKNIVSGRKFAIKILKQEFSQNEAFINLMRREADVLHNVINDAVVRYNELLKSEMHGGFVFLVMEFIEGQQLAEIMQASGGMAPEALLQIASRMGQGLAAAHAQNAFHRDISPDNIILPGGDPTKAKLIDFGIARDISENAQTVVGGGFAGKYQYASPEQLNGDVDARSDLYSLGVTLLNAYRGQSSQIGSSLMEIVQAKAQRVDTRDVPGKLGELIARLCEPRPEDRFQSANEMVAWLGGGATMAPAPSAPPEPTMIIPSKANTGFQSLPDEPTRSSGVGKFVLLLLIIALGGAGWYFGAGPGKSLLFPPAYQAQSPYSIALQHEAGTPEITISGYVHGPEASAEMLNQLQLGFSEFSLAPTLENASGAPNEQWEHSIVSLAKAAKPLTGWAIEISDLTVALTGEAADETIAAAVKSSFESAALQANMQARIALTVPVPPVPLAELNTLLTTYQTCGPMRVTGGDGTLLGPDDPITVSGIIARETDVEVFDLVLEEAAPGHEVAYNLAVLNAPVCAVEALLPAPQENGVEILYSYGQKQAEVGNQPFHEGDNPVIDVLLPPTASGFLYAFYIDAEGQVFHLLPHQSRQTHTVPPLGEMVDGKNKVRLIYPVSEASTAKLGFRVTGPFGTNMVIVVLSQRPLFDGLRPRAESSAALMEALAPQAALLHDPETLVTSRYLVTDP